MNKRELIWAATLTRSGGVSILKAGDPMKHRAKPGGEHGMNGEHYKGGTFLPRTKLPKQGAQGKKQGTGKQLVQPGVLEVPPVGTSAIFSTIQNYCTKTGDPKDPVLHLFPKTHPCWEYMANEFADPNIYSQYEELCRAYNAGERYFKL